MTEPFLPGLQGFGFFGQPEQHQYWQAVKDLQFVHQHGDGSWHVNNSSWESYAGGVSFKGLGQTLDEVVASPNIRGGGGLDIAGGSDGIAMRELLKRGTLSHAAITNFEDRRGPETQADSRLFHIDGDLLEPKTWQKIFHWQRQHRDVSLITHRPLYTLQWFQPGLYRGAANQLIDMIEPGGVFFAQVPISLSKRASKRICQELARRNDVSDVFTAPQVPTPRGVYDHVLVVKAA